MSESMNSPEYKRFFRFSIMAELHKEAYRSTNDFFGSLKEAEASLFASYKRFGVGYTYSEEADFDSNYNREITDREHEFRVKMGIGKPSEGWNIRLSYETEIGEEDEYGIYIGKEMGYYEWAVGYIKEFDRTEDRYEDSFAIQFTLLTFPENPIFGIGYKDENRHVSPQLWFGSGLEVDGPDSM
jgi:hypothetical protein